MAAVFSPSPLSPSVEMKTQSLVVGACCLLRVPAWLCSPRLSVRGSPRRSSRAVLSSSCHRCQLLAFFPPPPCPSSRFAVSGVRRLCSCFAIPCGRRAVCRIGPGGSCCGVLIPRGFSSCLLTLRWCRIALLPVFDKTGGAWLLGFRWRWRCSHRFLIGVSSGLALLTVPYPCRRDVPLM